MKNHLVITLLLALLCFSKAHSQKAVKLFNQKNLVGWYAYEPASGKQKDAAKVFHADKKMIRMYGEKLGYLMSEKSFQNFKLTVQYKWNLDSTFSRKSTKKNSGIMYLVPNATPDTLWPQGIQFQVKEGATGDFVMLQGVTMEIKGKKNEAGKSVVSPRFEDAEKPFGEWNTVVVTCQNGYVKQELNGKLVNEGTKASVAEGRILLQYEGYPIDFRKLFIKEL